MKEEALWSQQARCNCVKERNLNTAFFLRTINIRKRRKVIASLKQGYDVVDDQDGINKVVDDSFRGLFGSESNYRWLMDGNPWTPIRITRGKAKAIGA